MQIVIPMSGIGRRFLEAGYTDPKPLIRVDGRPMIEFVIGLFPGETNFLFICNEDHLRETPLREVLSRCAPTGKIVGIEPHKLGPVYAVAQAFEHIADDEEVIVNYCDFSKYWDYSDFLQHTRSRGADGAISAYRGFHPHMLGTTNYAFMRSEHQWMLEIQEKKPFTDNRMSEYASDGTYYFRTGSLLKNYFQKLLDSGQTVNGEYYVSMVYNLLVQDGLKVSIYEIQHMLQWGTPQDLEEYQRWSDYFRALVEHRPLLQPRAGSVNLIPLAGRGSRFSQAGYQLPKPLIPVSGKPMIVQASESLPPAERRIFLCLGEHLDQYPLERELRQAYPHAEILRVDRVTEGQACTARLGLDTVDHRAPLLIGACDNGALWDQEKWRALTEDASADCVVWSFRHHPSSANNPQMYGWLRVDDSGRVIGVSVKKPISDTPFDDHAIVGTFFFREARLYLEAYEALIRKNVRVNGEFYIDSLIGEVIEAGYVVRVFEVQHYVGWGTPNDLKTFEYWQSFFHKCSWHPYSADQDPFVDQGKRDQIVAGFFRHVQPHR